MNTANKKQRNNDRSPSVCSEHPSPLLSDRPIDTTDNASNSGNGLQIELSVSIVEENARNAQSALISMTTSDVVQSKNDEQVDESGDKVQLTSDGNLALPNSFISVDMSSDLAVSEENPSSNVKECSEVDANQLFFSLSKSDDFPVVCTALVTNCNNGKCTDARLDASNSQTEPTTSIMQVSTFATIGEHENYLLEANENQENIITYEKDNPSFEASTWTSQDYQNESAFSVSSASSVGDKRKHSMMQTSSDLPVSPLSDSNGNGGKQASSTALQQQFGDDIIPREDQIGSRCVIPTGWPTLTNDILVDHHEKGTKIWVNPFATLKPLNRWLDTNRPQLSRPSQTTRPSLAKPNENANANNSFRHPTVFSRSLSSNNFQNHNNLGRFTSQQRIYASHSSSNLLHEHFPAIAESTPLKKHWNMRCHFPQLSSTTLNDSSNLFNFLNDRNNGFNADKSALSLTPVCSESFSSAITTTTTTMITNNNHTDSIINLSTTSSSMNVQIEQNVFTNLTEFDSVQTCSFNNSSSFAHSSMIVSDSIHTHFPAVTQFEQSKLTRQLFNRSLSQTDAQTWRQFDPIDGLVDTSNWGSSTSNTCHQLPMNTTHVNNPSIGLSVLSNVTMNPMSGYDRIDSAVSAFDPIEHYQTTTLGYSKQRPDCLENSGHAFRCSTTITPLELQPSAFIDNTLIQLQPNLKQNIEVNLSNNRNVDLLNICPEMNISEIRHAKSNCTVDNINLHYQCLPAHFDISCGGSVCSSTNTDLSIMTDPPVTSNIECYYRNLLNTSHSIQGATLSHSGNPRSNYNSLDNIVLSSRYADVLNNNKSDVHALGQAGLQCANRYDGIKSLANKLRMRKEQPILTCVGNDVFCYNVNSSPSKSLFDEQYTNAVCGSHASGRFAEPRNPVDLLRYCAVTDSYSLNDPTYLRNQTFRSPCDIYGKHHALLQSVNTNVLKTPNAGSLIPKPLQHKISSNFIDPAHQESSLKLNYPSLANPLSKHSDYLNANIPLNSSTNRDLRNFSVLKDSIPNVDDVSSKPGSMEFYQTNHINKNNFPLTFGVQSFTPSRSFNYREVPSDLLNYINKSTQQRPFPFTDTGNAPNAFAHPNGPAIPQRSNVMPNTVQRTLMNQFQLFSDNDIQIALDYSLLPSTHFKDHQSLRNGLIMLKQFRLAVHSGLVPVSLLQRQLNDYCKTLLYNLFHYQLRLQAIYFIAKRLHATQRMDKFNEKFMVSTHKLVSNMLTISRHIRSVHSTLVHHEQSFDVTAMHKPSNLTHSQSLPSMSDRGESMSHYRIPSSRLHNEFIKHCGNLAMGFDLPIKHHTIHGHNAMIQPHLSTNNQQWNAAFHNHNFIATSQIPPDTFSPTTNLVDSSQFENFNYLQNSSYFLEKLAQPLVTGTQVRLDDNDNSLLNKLYNNQYIPVGLQQCSNQTMLVQPASFPSNEQPLPNPDLFSNEAGQSIFSNHLTSLHYVPKSLPCVPNVYGSKVCVASGLPNVYELTGIRPPKFNNFIDNLSSTQTFDLLRLPPERAAYLANVPSPSLPNFYDSRNFYSVATPRKMPFSPTKSMFKLPPISLYPSPTLGKDSMFSHCQPAHFEQNRLECDHGGGLLSTELHKQHNAELLYGKHDGVSSRFANVLSMRQFPSTDINHLSQVSAMDLPKIQYSQSHHNNLPAIRSMLSNNNSTAVLNNNNKEIPHFRQPYQIPFVIGRSLSQHPGLLNMEYDRIGNERAFNSLSRCQNDNLFNCVSMPSHHLAAGSITCPIQRPPFLPQLISDPMNTPSNESISVMTFGHLNSQIENSPQCSDFYQPTYSIDGMLYSQPCHNQFYPFTSFQDQ